QAFALANEFTAHIDVAGMRPHREGRDQASFDKMMRIVAHDIAVLAGTGLGLVCVDNKIVRPLLDLFRHEGPLESGGESSSTAAAQTGPLHLVNQRFGAAGKNLLRAVPQAPCPRAFKAPVLKAVEVGEYAVPVGKHRYAALGSSASMR